MCLQPRSAQSSSSGSGGTVKLGQASRLKGIPTSLLAARGRKRWWHFVFAESCFQTSREVIWCLFQTCLKVVLE